jgi:3-methylcrotonyl-CoA carboxylase alpha subunit
MLAKLIVHGADRADALARLSQALRDVEVAGVTTNTAFLQRVVNSKPFRQGEIDTGLIERHRAELFAPSELPVELLAAAAYAELDAEERAARAQAQRSGDPHSPWHSVDGWRLNEASHHDFVFLEGEQAHAVRVGFGGPALRMAIGAAEFALSGEALEDGRLLLRLDGRVLKARAVRDGADWHVFCDGEYRRLALKEPLQGAGEDAEGGLLTAPMPGRITQVLARAGQAVKRGEPLLVLEAMKMEHTITAPADGVVDEVHFSAGEQVLEGVELIKLRPHG